MSSSFAVQTEVLPPIFPVHEGVIGIAGVASGVAGYGFFAVCVCVCLIVEKDAH